MSTNKNTKSFIVMIHIPSIPKVFCYFLTNLSFIHPTRLSYKDTTYHSVLDLSEGLAPMSSEDKHVGTVAN